MGARKRQAGGTGGGTGGARGGVEGVSGVCVYVMVLRERDRHIGDAITPRHHTHTQNPSKQFNLDKQNF